MMGGQKEEAIMAAPWAEAENQHLRELVAEHKSAGQIAKTMGKTRNAVVGQVYRMGLKLTGQLRRPSNIGPKKRVRKAKKSDSALVTQEVALQAKVAISAPTIPEAPKPPQSGLPVGRTDGIGILSVSDHVCRWPITGENVPPRDHRFCGCGIDFGKIYCPDHWQIAKTVAAKRADAKGRKHDVTRIFK